MADRAMVLEHGQVALAGAAADPRLDRRVQEIYLGFGDSDTTLVG
jgi:ABC-type branched-subunit amino acid transport system ATPase component